MSYCLFSSDKRIARKQHRCIWCGHKIHASESYIDERSVYDGSIQRHRWHPECHEAGCEQFRSGEEEFTAWDNERPSIKTNLSNNEH